MRIGVLGFQGSVIEHIHATSKAARNLGIGCAVADVRTKEELDDIDGLIIPGGESTTIYKLCERAGMLDRMRSVPCIFGTCAGAIMLAKSVSGAEEGQKTLGLMDMDIDRNAYGRQAESFSMDLDTKLGALNAVFIRAPKIRSVGKSVAVLAERDGAILACEERGKRSYYLAACFHPELSTTVFHEHFLRRILDVPLKF